MYHPKNGATAEVVLSSSVADDGTLTVEYPSGFTQDSFNAGLADYGQGHVMVGDNDKWNEADPGFAFSFGSSNITVTNQTGASIAAGTKLRLFFKQRASNAKVWLHFPINLADVSAADIVTDFRPGVAGYIEYVQWAQGKPVTTAAKAATLNLEIGTTDVTGGTVALTSATATPLGKVIAGSQITGNNRVEVSSKISVEASAVTAFAEGDGVLSIRIGLDDADSR